MRYLVPVYLQKMRLGAFSYWRGSVATIGGALLLGAFPRIKRHRRVRDALLMGLGFAIVAGQPAA